jgi:hypothetical protein
LRARLPAWTTVLGAASLFSLALFASTDTGSFSPSLQAATLNALPAYASTPASFFEAVSDYVHTPAPEPPLTRDRLVSMVRQTWPEDPDRAESILYCESHAGDDPATFSLETPNGGPMQISRYTWEDYFLVNYSWDWRQIVQDVTVHLLAARVIYDRAGGWSAWRC